MTIEPDELAGRTNSQLFALYRAILRELRSRQVVRTENAPAGDYAEFLVASALDGTLAPNSEKSYDVLANGRRIQVKARVVSDPIRSSQLQLSPFRSFDFDEAVIVLFDDLDYSIRQAVSLPVATVKEASAYNAHVNGHIVHARPALITGPGSTDITSLLRRAA